MIPMSDLKIGERGVIRKLNFRGAVRQRLLAMGLVQGETVLVRRVAPLGDPTDYIVKGYHLSMRKKDAQEVLVDRINGE